MTALTILPFRFRPAAGAAPGRVILICAALLCALPFLITLCFVTIPRHHLVIPPIAVHLQVLIHFALIALITPPLTAGAITAEFEQNTWDLLRLTRLTSGYLITLKLKSASRSALFITLAFLPAYLLDLAAGGCTINMLLQLHAIALAATTFCVLVGLACSSLSHRTSQSILAAYLITGFLFVVPALADPLLVPYLHAHQAAVCRLLSPLLAAFASTTQQPRQHLLPHLGVITGICMLFLMVARAKVARLLAAD